MAPPPKTAYKPGMSEHQTAAELIQQGLVHHRAGQISLAMDRYTQVLRNDPQNADALYYIAVIACHEGQFQQGIDLARRSLSFRSGQARAYNLIGQALHRMGRSQRSTRKLRQGARMRRQFRRRLWQPRKYADRARPHMPKRYQASIVPLRSTRNPHRTGSTAAPRLHGVGRVEDAIASYDKAIALDPDFCVTHYNRAHALLDAGRNDEALAAYDRAIALEPKMAEAYLGRALVLKKLARLDDALASVDKAIEMKGDVAKMHEARASLLRDLGRDEDARAADARAAELAAKVGGSNSSAPPAN